MAGNPAGRPAVSVPVSVRFGNTVMFVLNKTINRFLKVAAIGLLLATSVSFVSHDGAYALPAIPERFYGEVRIGSKLAPAGTPVVASIAGTNLASTATDAQGRYGYDPVFMVPADDPLTVQKEGGVAGDTIDFSVGGKPAGSAVFRNGGVIALDLVSAPDLPVPDDAAASGIGGTRVWITVVVVSIAMGLLAVILWRVLRRRGQTA